MQTKRSDTMTDLKRRVFSWALLCMMVLSGLAFVTATVPRNVEAAGGLFIEWEYYLDVYGAPIPGMNTSNYGGYMGPKGSVSDGWEPIGNLSGNKNTIAGPFIASKRYDVATGNYSLTRGYMIFNTSKIPTNAIIQSVYVRLWGDADYFASGQWQSADETIEHVGAVDFYQFDVENNMTLSKYNDSDFSPGNYIGSLSPYPSLGLARIHGTVYLDIGRINRTGWTTVGMRLANEATAPLSGEWMMATIDRGTDTTTYGMWVEYIVPGELTYEEDGGLENTVISYPMILPLNGTHELYIIEFDTWGTVNNVSVVKGDSTWDYLSSVPYATAINEDSLYVNLTGVVVGVTYRVYFAVPITTFCDVYLYPYSESTGEGFAFETFRYKYSEGSTYNNSTALDVFANPTSLKYGSLYTFAALDYFGNVATTRTILTNAAKKTLDMPIPVNSFKVFNQREDFVKIKIYYEGAGTPLTYYSSPMETTERFLKDGNYTIVVTFYTDDVAGTSQYAYLNVTDAEFLLLRGLTISRVISDVAGVHALQTVITNLVTPDVVFVSDNLPGVSTESDEECIYIHPWSIVTAEVDNAYNGTSSELWLPYPTPAGATTTVIDDELRISGNWTTEIWLNYTNGTSFAHYTNCPSFVELDGGNYTLNSTASINAQRHTKFRQETVFYYTYYTSTKRYTVTLTLDNTLAYTNWTKVCWFVGFQENKTIGTQTVRVYDLNNDLWLVPGRNYDVTQTGILMYWDRLNSSTSRSFTFSFYDLNVSDEQGIAIAYADTFDTTKLGDEAYYVARATWTNPFPADYSGQMQIRLDFKEAKYVDPTSVVIKDNAANRNLSPTEFTVAGGVITISSVSVPLGGVQTYDVYFKLDMVSSTKFDVMSPAFYVGGFAVSWLLLLIVVTILFFAWFLADYWTVDRWNYYAFVSAILLMCLTVILYYFSQVNGGL